jgi:uncharacterized protein (TIGR03643 family)
LKARSLQKKRKKYPNFQPFSGSNVTLSKAQISKMDIVDLDRIIEMAWEDRTPFEAIKIQFGLAESEVIALMRKELKRSSFNLWRKRVNSGVSMKHLAKRSDEVDRFKCTRQRSISMNKISKR